MNGQRPQSISKVLIHQSALARLYFVKDFEDGHSVELKPISYSCHLFRFTKWSEKRFKCQQKGLGRRTTRLLHSSPTVVFWMPLKAKCVTSCDPRVTSKPCLCFMLLWMWIDAVYGMGLVLPHKKMECNSVCNPSTHLDDAGTAWKSNGLAWNLRQQVSCKGNDHLLVTLERGIHKIKHESAHSM